MREHRAGSRGYGLAGGRSCSREDWNTLLVMRQAIYGLEGLGVTIAAVNATVNATWTWGTRNMIKNVYESTGGQTATANFVNALVCSPRPFRKVSRWTASPNNPPYTVHPIKDATPWWIKSAIGIHYGASFIIVSFSSLVFGFSIFSDAINNWYRPSGQCLE